MNNRKTRPSASAISALKLKLEKLQNEKEKVRGFTEGGASTTEEQEGQKDLDAQITYIQEEISEFEERIANAIEDLQEVVADMRKATIDNNFSENNYGDMENLADQYRALGIDCEVVSGDYGFEISVKNQGNFAGENLLEMSAEEVADLLDEIEEQLDQERKNESGDAKEEESSRKKEKESPPKESADHDDEEQSTRRTRYMAMAPGDVVEEKEEKKDGEDKNSSKKEEPKKDKKSKSPLQDVEPGERFDHGLGRGGYANNPDKKIPRNQGK